jgi:hypothetical protein
MTKQQRDAVSTLRAFFGLGLAFAVIGGIMLTVFWPHLEIDAVTGADMSGSTTGVAIGWLLLAIANMLLFVALIGYGVKLGREASPAPTPE